MKKVLSLFLVLGLILMVGGIVKAYEFPEFPKEKEFVDDFFVITLDRGDTFVDHIYCYVIKEATIVNKEHSDKNFDYITVYRLVARAEADHYLEEEKYPSIYMYDENGDGRFSEDEMRYELIADGWNGNEVMYAEYELNRNFFQGGKIGL